VGCGLWAVGCGLWGVRVELKSSASTGVMTPSLLCEASFNPGSPNTVSTLIRKYTHSYCRSQMTPLVHWRKVGLGAG
jgi:mevalonate pyrophosphate decarboxylase